MSTSRYATTAYRCQGRTVDTTHTLIDAATTREVLYVAATRGRDDNHLYVDVAYDPDPQTSHGQPREATPYDVLAAVLANPGAETSAHQTMRQNQHDSETWATLAAEYHTLAGVAQTDRWDALLLPIRPHQQQLQAVKKATHTGRCTAHYAPPKPTTSTSKTPSPTSSPSDPSTPQPTPPPSSPTASSTGPNKTHAGQAAPARSHRRADPPRPQRHRPRPRAGPHRT